jgi:hypothetical protein
MLPSLNDFLDRIRSLFLRIADSLKKDRKPKAVSQELSFVGVCPFCGLLTPRKRSRCLECGKSLKLA